MRFLYSKRDRLHSSKDIEKLFHSGKAFFSFPIRLIFLEHTETDMKVRSAAIAPKKKLPKAHDRNRVKRLIRELIRHQLPLIREDASHPLNKTDFIIVYSDTNPRVKLSTLEQSYEKIIAQIRNAKDSK